jgi:colicin import membrane protein
VVKVKLIAPPGSPAPRKPAPKVQPEPAPQPAPPKAPEPPAPKKVLLPAEPARSAEPAKPKPRPKPAAKKPPPEPRPDPKESYQDVLAGLREAAGEPEPQPVEVAQAEPLPGVPAGGVGVQVSAEEAAWRRRAKLHVHRAWVLAPGFRMQALETEVRVRLGPGGHVLDLRLSRSSGNPWYDESVERAIRKASPLPKPPEPGEWTFLFRPEDLFG